MRYLTLPVAGKLAVPAIATIMIMATACAGGGNDTAAVTKVTRDYFAKPAEFSPGLMHGKVAVTVSDAAAPFFRSTRPRQVSDVSMKKISFTNKHNEEATAQITFRLAAEGVSCDATEVLLKKSASWEPLTFTVSACTRG